MRLIDADTLEKFIKNNICAVGDDKKLLTAGDDNRWHKLLDFIPTAYDVEKVVERLENESYRIDDSATLSSRDVVDIEDAIEIVKSGGID